MLPVAVVDRGGLSLKAASGPAAISFARARLAENKASALPGLPSPAWVYLHGVKSDLSSTAIRAAREHGEEREEDSETERDDG
jgi:nicotinate-nucleotide adenylyltransferase